MQKTISSYNIFRHGLTGFFYIITRPSGVLLLAQDKLVQEMIAQIVILIVTVSTCYVGFEWGIEGVSWAFLISQVFTAIYFYILVYQTIPTRVSDLFKAMTPGVLMNSVLFLILYATDSFSGELIKTLPELYLVIMVGIGGLTYLGILKQVWDG